MWLLQQTLFTPQKAGELGARFGNNLAGEGSFIAFINELLAIAFFAAGALGVIYIFWGGFQFIFSGGDDEKVKNSFSTIRYAILGLLVTFVSFSLVAFVGGIFGLDLVGYISIDRIIESFQKFLQ